MNSIVHSFQEVSVQNPDRIAVISQDVKLNYADLAKQSDGVAFKLAQQGIGKGDRVGLYCMNSDFFVIAYLGILKAGGVVVPINLLQSPSAIAYILNDSGAKGLIYHEAFSESALFVRQNVAELAFSIRIGSPSADALDWHECVLAEGPAPQIDFKANEDLAVILYTSGTTGHPKGAMLTHANLLANVESVRQAMCWRPGQDIVLVVLPLFHAFAATVGMLTPLLNACALAVLAKFEPDSLASSIAETQASIFLGVPSMYNMLLRLKPEKVDLLGSLRFCVSGGAALPVEILRRFEAMFGKKIYEGDGPTECSPVTCVNPIGGLIKPGTVGLPVPGVEMRIVGEQGLDSLPKGEVGEIAVRGCNVMKGYWNQPEATAEVFREDWLLTGDLGTEDEDGYFSIVDRKKDLIIVNGMNVYPRVVEEFFHKAFQIAEVAVVGEPHALHGEIPIAYVVLRQGFEMTETEMKAACRRDLGRHEIPKKIIFMPELPKNAAGKILKRQLRKQGEIERGVI